MLRSDLKNCLLARSLYKLLRGLLARSLCEISVQATYKALLARSMKETAWQDLCNRSLRNVSVQDLQKRRPGKISVQDLYNGLLARSLGEISVQALYKSSVGKIPVRDLLARFQQISMQCLCTRSLQDFSCQDLCVSSLQKTSLSRSLRKISLTIQMSTAPQRERSDTPKVPRGLRERSQNSHRAAARAI